MLLTRPAGRLAAAAAVAALAACSSSATAGSGSVDRASAGPSRTTASPSAGGSAAPGASGLAYRLHRAVAGLTSDHLEFTIATGGRTERGSGDQKLSQGRTLAYRLTETLPQGGSLTLVKVGTSTWAKLPTTANSAKPYTLVTTSSADPQIQALATSLQSSAAAEPLQTTGVFVASARTVRTVGTATIGGVRTTHYAVDIDPARLPADFPQKAAIVSSGLTSIPVELYVDAENRPVRVVERVTVQGTTIDTTFTQSRFNVPVTITAPPASQVSTR